MKIKLLGMVSVLGGIALMACGDDTGVGGAGGATTSGPTTTTATGTTKATTTGSMTTTQASTTSGMACSVVGDASDCAGGCQILWDCGILECGGAQNCVGFMADDEATFIGDAMSGCIQGCEAQPALLALLDPDDCATTIATIKAASTDFEDACDNGVGTGGGGG